VRSGNASVEDEVVFTCYYPDGATNTNCGGFSSPNEFKKFVEDMQAKNFDLQFKAHLTREFVTCSDGDHLVGAFLLQFPYGVGSMDKLR
jgi:dihydroorotase